MIIQQQQNYVMKKLLIVLLFSSTTYIVNGQHWAKCVGSTLADNGFSITVDGSGNVYITGYFSSTVDFDPGPGTAYLSSVGYDDIFFAKYNSSGALEWAKQIGSTLIDYAFSLAVDGSGSVYITGNFQGTNVDFDPGSSTVTLTSAGSFDIFFAKFNSLGDFDWAKRIGGSAMDVGMSIAIDGSGNVYIIGYFNSTADFDPGSGTTSLTSAGGTDIFFAKFNSLGDFGWAKRIGGSSTDDGRSITVDGNGNLYIAGYFSGTVDFDPESSTVNLTSAGDTDIFFGKYGASNGALLPLKWHSFTATKQNKNVLLEWSTVMEQNTKDFIVQHSNNGTSWNNMNTQAAAGNSSSIKNYIYLHTAPLKGNNYYRILQKDLDERFSYSEVRMVKTTPANSSFSVLVNPVTNNLLQINCSTAQLFTLYSGYGKIIWSKQFAVGTHSIDLNDLAKGIYLLKANDQTEKIVVN